MDIPPIELSWLELRLLPAIRDENQKIKGTCINRRLRALLNELERHSQGDYNGRNVTP